MEDEGSEGATTGNCRFAGMLGLGWDHPSPRCALLVRKDVLTWRFLVIGRLFPYACIGFVGSMESVVGGLPWGGADTP